MGRVANKLWQDLPSVLTPINAANLNDLEARMAAGHAQAGSVTVSSINLVNASVARTANTIYVVQLLIPWDCTMTGLQYWVGTVSAGNARCALYDASGARVANRTTNSAQPGAGLLHAFGYDAPVAIAGGIYYAGLIFDSGTATAYAGTPMTPSAALAQGGFSTPATISVSSVGGNNVPALSTY